MAGKNKRPTEKEIKDKVDLSHIKVDTWTDLHTHLEEMRDSVWIFRGVSARTHYLIPAIGRNEWSKDYSLLREKRLFEEFKNRAACLVDGGNFNDWGWLAYAQHFGVPTRLLDWSVSPLVALYFALQADSTDDRVLYAVKFSKFIHEVNHPTLGPFKNKVEGRFTAPLAFERIRAQRGVFTVHPSPKKIFNPPGLKSFVIDGSKVSDFQRRLFKYGFDHSSIYPDAGGLGKQLRWQYKNGVGLGQVLK